MMQSLRGSRRQPDCSAPMERREEEDALHQCAVGARLVSTRGRDNVDIGLADRLVEGDAAAGRRRGLVSSVTGALTVLRAADESGRRRRVEEAGMRGEERARRTGRNEERVGRATHESSPEGRVTMLELPRVDPRRLAMSCASCGCDVPASSDGSAMSSSVAAGLSRQGQEGGEGRTAEDLDAVVGRHGGRTEAGARARRLDRARRRAVRRALALSPPRPSPAALTVARTGRLSPSPSLISLTRTPSAPFLASVHS